LKTFRSESARVRDPGKQILARPSAATTSINKPARPSLLNGGSGLTAEMALPLSQAFGSTPEHWLRVQLAYDLWQAKRRTEKLHVKQFFAPAPG
jgi:addiction module HigA family antidote